MSEQHDDGFEDEVVAPAARGLFTGWLAAKTIPALIRLVVWTGRLVVVSVYGAFVWFRTRRAALSGALDDQIDPGFAARPSIVVRERGLLGWIRGPRDDIAD